MIFPTIFSILSLCSSYTFCQYNAFRRNVLVRLNKKICHQQADFVRNGNVNQIMKLSKSNTTDLWNAVIDNDYATFSRINQGLLNTPKALKHVPLRVYIPSAVDDAVVAVTQGGNRGSGWFRVAQGLVQPVDSNRKAKTLGQALKELMPDLFPSTRNALLAEVVQHGAKVPFGAPLGDLMREASYPDGWLCLVVTV